MSTAEPVYLDHNATTPVAAEVRDAMLPWLGGSFGNPSSGHWHGRRAAEAVAAAREHVGRIIGAGPSQIIFTGGGTEADNLALRRSRCARKRVVTSAVEHPAVAEPAAWLREAGWSWDALPVGSDGAVDLDAAAPVLAEPTGLLSVILAQNETGAIQPVAELSALARASAPDVVVHTDAAQAVGKVPVDVDALGVDLLTLVSHKLYGPCGIGALYVRSPNLVEGWALGGGQEGGVRPGTEPVALIVGLGEACRIALRDLHTEGARVASLRDRLQALLCAKIATLHVTVPARRLPNTLHLCFPGCIGGDVLAEAPEIAASTGSACHTDGGGGGTLGAMGISPGLTRGAVRLSLGRGTQAHQIDEVSDALFRAWSRRTTSTTSA